MGRRSTTRGSARACSSSPVRWTRDLPRLVAAGAAGVLEKDALPDEIGDALVRIAAQLHLAPSTVKTHLQRLYDRLQLSGRAAAVAEGMRRGVID